MDRSCQLVRFDLSALPDLTLAEPLEDPLIRLLTRGDGFAPAQGRLPR
jgi:hypothetical protein